MLPLLLSKRTVASLCAVLVLAPAFFLLPFAPKTGVLVAHATVTNIDDNGPNAALCDILSWEKFKGCIANTAYTLIVGVPMWILGLIGIVFDVVLAVTLSSNIINNQDFVAKGWVVLRDISNTFFIFVLLYIAISTILQTAGGQTKKLLATLIMVALFMNFSLYATKFVIDVSNVFALEFYKHISAGPLTKVKITNLDINPPLSVSAGIVNAISFQKLIGENFVANVNTALTFKIFVFVMVGIMVMIICFTLLSASILFLARVVGLWLLMMLSSLAFFSMILPYTRGKVWTKWSSELVSQAFFAPIFLFFLYFTLILAQTLKATPMFAANGDAGSGTENHVVIVIVTFLNFFAIITVLLTGLKTAKGMSGALGAAMGDIGKRASGYTKTATGVGVGVGFAGAGMLYRNTVGKLARRKVENERAELEKTPEGRRKLAVYNTLASGSGDMRNIPLIGAAFKKVAGMGGIDVGFGQGFGKGGDTADVAAKQKAFGDEVKRLLARDPEAAANYAATHEWFGNRDLIGMMEQLTVAQRDELIRNAKPGKQQNDLKAANEALGKRMTAKEKETEQKAKRASDTANAKETLEAWDTDNVSVDADTTDAGGNVIKSRINQFKAMDPKDQLALYKNMSAKHRKDFLEKEGDIFDALQGKLSEQDKFSITEAAQKFEEVDKKRMKKEGDDIVKTLEGKALPDQVAAFNALTTERQKKSAYRSMAPQQREELANADAGIKTVFDNFYTEISKNRADKQSFDEAAQKSREVEKKARSAANLAANKEKLKTASDSAAVADIFKGMQPKDIAQVDPDILLKPHVVQNLSGAAIGKIATDGNFNQGQINSLVGMILSPANIQTIPDTALEALQKSTALSEWTSEQQKKIIADEMKRRYPTTP